MVARVVPAREPAQPIPAQLVERPKRRARLPPEAHHRDHVLAESRRNHPVERVPGLSHEASCFGVGEDLDVGAGERAARRD
ncbi:MAG: hypothetical protein KF738_12965 [Burkholderiales bacterium]|nr:hypothetical protein [Burkholderiales bacterium]